MKSNLGRMKKKSNSNSIEILSKFIRLLSFTEHITSFIEIFFSDCKYRGKIKHEFKILNCT